MAPRSFTKTELGQYNGANGVPAYIAYQGVVYDVSHSFHWQHGKHQVLHTAGTDLTRELAEAPHGADLLEKFPIVGFLRSEKTSG